MAEPGRPASSLLCLAHRRSRRACISHNCFRADSSRDGARGGTATLLAGAYIAHAIEALGSISTVQAYRPSGASQALCYARTCYDHLAGNLAVRLTAAWERKRLIVAQGEREYEVTASGARLLREWGINADELRQSRRSFARRCLDWTERKDHLAGALGAAVCQKLVEFRWITRHEQSRVVHVSPRGERELERLLA